MVYLQVMQCITTQFPDSSEGEDALKFKVDSRFTPTRVGNTGAPCCFACPASGSPPRVWGILIRFHRLHNSLRFTPTRVGNTKYLSNLMAGTIGSPPRVWGIPPNPSKARTNTSVHPHACGEYWRRSMNRVVFAGSPPRVWGIRSWMQFCVRRPRFTPTRVGNTQAHNIARGTHPVHPHACGEYELQADFNAAGTGSPPRVWGIRG